MPKFGVISTKVISFINNARKQIIFFILTIFGMIRKIFFCSQTIFCIVTSGALFLSRFLKHQKIGKECERKLIRQIFCEKCPRIMSLFSLDDTNIFEITTFLTEIGYQSSKIQVFFFEILRQKVSPAFSELFQLDFVAKNFCRVIFRILRGRYRIQLEIFFRLMCIMVRLQLIIITS